MPEQSQQQRTVIFHLLTAFGIGGAERLIERLMPGATDFQHVVISLRGDGPIRKDFDRAGLKTEVLNAGSLLSVAALYRFWKLTRQYRPAILSTCLAHADMIGRVWGKLCGIPAVTCYLVARYRDQRYAWLVRAMRWTDWLVDGYIACSEEVQRYFVDDVHLPKKKFTIIVNSVDATKFRPSADSASRQHVLTELKLPPDAVIVGTVSNLRQEKCVDRLVAALPIAFENNSHAYSIIVGRGVFQPALEVQAEHLGIADRVRFVGYWPDLYQMLPVLDIFVLPSMFEGMSIALLEAMATARAIIVTDTPENGEVITPGTGLLVDTANPKVFGGAIRRLLQDADQRAQFGAAARMRAEQHFSLAQSVVEIQRFYHQFI